MESKIVIIVDTDKFDDNNRKLISYVAESRARTLLHIFYKESEKGTMNKMMMKGFEILAE